MHRRILVLAGVIAAAAVAVFAFGATSASSASSTLSFNLVGLEPLASGHYEGWAIFGEEKVPTGKFNLTASGALQTLEGQTVSSFEVERDLNGADMIVLTIEPDGDVDAVPSGIVVLAGPLSGTSATLAFPVDLGLIGGGYILATPTDDPDVTTNDVAGLWFLDPSGPSAALTLPELPGGWVYEGWGVTQGTPLSSGAFTSADGADMAAPFSGPNPGPPFPGEDFVANLPSSISGAVDLSDGASTIVISIEPYLNGIDPTGTAPFSIKPLVGDVPAGLADHTLTALGQNLGTVPGGSASISGGDSAASPAPPAAGDADLAVGGATTSQLMIALLVIAAGGLALGTRRLTDPR